MMNSTTKSSRFNWLVLLPLILVTLACGYCSTIDSSQRAVLTLNGGVQRIGDAGEYFVSIDPRTDLAVIDVSAHSADWEDPTGLVTEDEQPIGLALNVTYSRSRDDASITNMWNNYHEAAVDNAQLQSLVLARLPGAAKTATAQLTVGQMLGTEPLRDSQIAEIAAAVGITQEELGGAEGRLLLTNMIEILLQREVDDEIGIDILAVTVTNVAPSEEFLELLERTANAIQERQAVIQERLTLQERLESEQVQTNINLEIANRQAEERRIAGQVYTNEAVLTIELARVWAEAINTGDAIIFVPEGSSVANVLGQSGVIPVTSSQIVEATPTPSS